MMSSSERIYCDPIKVIRVNAELNGGLKLGSVASGLTAAPKCKSKWG
jgi:hypothetical protein